MSESELLYVTYLFCYALLISLESIAVRMVPWKKHGSRILKPGSRKVSNLPFCTPRIKWVMLLKAKQHRQVAQKKGGALASTNEVYSITLTLLILLIKYMEVTFKKRHSSIFKLLLKTFLASNLAFSPDLST